MSCWPRAAAVILLCYLASLASSQTSGNGGASGGGGGGGANGRNLSNSCEDQLNKWMQSVPVRVHPDNATLDVDWSGLDARLSQLGCSYDQLWLELWRVSRIPDDERNFGSPDYFAKYERCNELNEQHFVYHSTQTHLGSAGSGSIHRGSSAISTDDDDDGISKQQLATTGATDSSTTFLHVVEENYILRLCPCGRRRQHQRVCDCDYGSGNTVCSGLLKVETKSKVYPWCTKEGARETYKDLIDVNSPHVACSQILMWGKMHSCTPIQDYDKVRVTLHQIDLARRMAETGVTNDEDFQCQMGHDFARKVRSEDVQLVRVGDIGEFSIVAENLTRQTSYCIQIELLDHPYCNIHHTVGHAVFQPPVCRTSILQPATLGPCESAANVETSITSEKDANNLKYGMILLGVILVVLLVAITGIALVFRFRKKPWQSGYRSKRNDFTMNDSPIIKNNKNGLTTTLYSHDFITRRSCPKAIFLLHFPESKKFEDTCGDLRNYLNGNGCRVFDLSDPQNDERISEDPEGWVTGVLCKQDVQVMVVDSALARLSLAATSSSTASTSLVSSSASVECRTHANSTSSSSGSSHSGHSEASTANVHDEVIVEEEDEEVRIPLSLAASRSGPPLPESAVEDNHHELRVYAIRQIQSRFSGKYNQLVVCRFDGCKGGGGNPNAPTNLPPPPATSTGTTTTTHLRATHNNNLHHHHHHQHVATESVAQILTPNVECLVLPHHLPELRSWLHGPGHFVSPSATGKTANRSIPSHPYRPHQLSEAQSSVVITMPTPPPPSDDHEDEDEDGADEATSALSSVKQSCSSNPPSDKILEKKLRSAIADLAASDRHLSV